MLKKVGKKIKGLLVRLFCFRFRANIFANGLEYEKMAIIYKIFIFFDSKFKINKRNMNDNVAIFLYALLANSISSWFLNYSANFKRYFILSVG